MKKLNTTKIVKFGFYIMTSGILISSSTNTSHAKTIIRDVDDLVDESGWDAKYGNRIYLGAYNGKPTTFRIIGENVNGILLDADEGLYIAPYNASLISADWGKSSLLQSLNGQDYLLNGNTFSAVESNIINTVDLAPKSNYTLTRRDGTSLSFTDQYAKTKIFSLSAAEVERYYKSDVDKVKDSVGLYWWLRSPVTKGNEAAYVSSTGMTGSLEVNQYLSSASPAMYVDEHTIKYIWPYGQKRETLGTRMEDDTSASTDWALCLEGGSGFSMSYLEGYDSSIRVRVNAIGNAADVDYDRLSAFLLDSDGDMLSYGLVKYSWALSEGDTFLVELGDVVDQVASVEFFMEDVGAYGVVASNSQVFDVSTRIDDVGDTQLSDDIPVRNPSASVVDTSVDSSSSEVDEEVLAFAMESGIGSQVLAPGSITASELVEGTWLTYVTETGEELSYSYVDGEVVYQNESVDSVNIDDVKSCDGHYFRFTGMLSLLGLQRWWWKRKFKVLG